MSNTIRLIESNSKEVKKMFEEDPLMLPCVFCGKENHCDDTEFLDSDPYCKNGCLTGDIQ